MRRITMHRTIVFVVGILLTNVVTMQAARQDKKDGGKETAVTARNNAVPVTDGKPGPAPATTDPAYMIGPEDVLDINVWKEPDMSRVVPVRPDGRISLPLINDVQASGLSPQELAATL